MNLSEPGALKAFLAKHGLSANKGLGQHFLCSGPVVLKSVDAIGDAQGVLEIGPGPGLLTGPLAERAERVIALEIDERMPAALAESAPAAEIRRVDALKVDLSEILAELPSPRAVVSNLPYYITGPLLTQIAAARRSFDVAVLMMQKEVAMRVLAKERESERGSLSVFLQSQFSIRKVTDAPAGAFMPPPKVDSTVLAFTPVEAPVPADEESAYFKLVRIGFTQPRKTLTNNLGSAYGGKERVLAALLQIGLTDKARPQELTLDQWAALSRALRA